MLNFLGITRHLSTTAGYAKRIGWLLHEDVTQSPFPVTGVSFTGAVKTEQGDLPIAITHGEQENYLELTFPALPIGRWPYAIHAQDESGEDLRLFAGYIGAVESVPPIEASTVYDIPVMGIAIPIEAGKTIKAQWLSNTAASLAAQQAQQDASSTRTDADTASQAAATATGAATTAVERAKEAEGYAGAAQASKVAASNSETAANTSAADAAHDARSANDAKTAVEGIVSDFTQTVSNGEQTISAAKEEAVSAIQAKQADSVLAVGRAQKTATDKVASAQGAAVTAVETAKTEAVQAVQTAQAEAMEAITPLVEQAETAKEEVDQAEGRIKTAETNAETSATSAITAATAAQQALAAIPQVDAAGNMTLAGGLTTAGTHNANGGINIPLAAGAPTDTMGINRAYALGMAHTVMMHQARTYWLTSSCTATNGVTINHVAPGCYCEAVLAANIRTSVKLPSAGALGGGNYSKIAGYSLPIKFSGGSDGSAFKLSMLIGGSGQFSEYPDAGIDDFRLRPVVGSVPDITRLVDVTLYYDNGYKARVRELIGIGIPKRYVVRTTLSDLNYDSNSNPCSATYRVVIAQSEIGHGDALAAGVWLMMGGLSNDTIIKLADIRRWDTYHVLYAPVIYLDAQAGLYGGVISAESPTIINGVGGNTYVRFGLEPYQKSWITTETEVPYTDEQPT
ncbi:hypothetical protein CXU13_11090 [Akkermansia muciniphila]|nr:hypothetical protein CXU12_00310 [Akkermansia muciniphila]PNC58355.1 hypothetical protein CXU13_11090 [Akkermansia muciniphila]